MNIKWGVVKMWLVAGFNAAMLYFCFCHCAYSCIYHCDSRVAILYLHYRSTCWARWIFRCCLPFSILPSLHFHNRSTPTTLGSPMMQKRVSRFVCVFVQSDKSIELNTKNKAKVKNQIMYTHTNRWQQLECPFKAQNHRSARKREQHMRQI